MSGSRAAARAAARASAAPRAGTHLRPVPEHARPVRRARPVARPRRGVRRRGRVRIGRLVIPLVALLLAGMVWVNVAKLGLTSQTGQVIERARAVQAETTQLKSQLDRSNTTVQQRAAQLLGMSYADGDAVTYLDAPRRPAGRPSGE